MEEGARRGGSCLPVRIFDFCRDLEALNFLDFALKQKCPLFERQRVWAFLFRSSQNSEILGLLNPETEKIPTGWQTVPLFPPGRTS